ncbi:S-ribosylhomocysteine lyase [Spirochaeta cellobiosiphila]|uniref:S-ribosylhomocysteine lyase n=1 Tax=Spirochaeta cellobiosiphila TaxID=504483 RepID=UPI0003FFF402|nr:S-ribosylhomocysteine lyase [Spirochaeta cellobiosiphila]
MDKIPSFTIDHNKLLRGIYVSRIDNIGSEHITTFDIRMKEPNREPVIDVPALHTIEHLGATFLRNHKVWGEKLIYFGPMGCRTGNYALFKGDLTSNDVLSVIKSMFEFIIDYQESIPGTHPDECGNYLSHDLNMAKWESKKYLNEVLLVAKDCNLKYPN